MWPLLILKFRGYLLYRRKLEDGSFFGERLFGGEFWWVTESGIMLESVLSIDVNDQIEWADVVGEMLNHPEMEVPGVRLHCHFLLGKMKGSVHMDMAFGDVVDAVKLPLERMQYKGKPFFGEELSLLVYPLETVFSEKLYIALRKGSQNTRMKDYYDLFKLSSQDLNLTRLKQNIESTFSKRNLELSNSINFNSSELERLEVYWKHFVNREEVVDAPDTMREIIELINRFLQSLPK